ncbi:MAG TPA: NrfD/PsrC family molybdoenzyme membrane anchor subunit [Terriglobia bacterium]|jgi:formate-dependent nitrite reductase membrane component NrfD
MSDAVVTYYDEPLLKKPVWLWSIPTYFYLGAAAGASLALGAAAQVMRAGSPELVRRCRWIGLAGVSAGTVLLIYDLGRPSRFLNMLRVFRPTSPMNVGSWLLSATGSLAGLSVVAGGAIGQAAAVGAGVLGVPLSGYTGVLLANTAMPVWQDGRRSLPALFVASGMASAGALFHLMDLPARDEAIAHRFALAGQAAELAAMVALERETSKVQRVAEPLRTGAPGLLWKVAKVLGAASLALSLFARKSPKAKTAAGLCGTAAALSLRFSLLQAGRHSALDPRAAIEQQRVRELPTDGGKARLVA